ncbi:MAG: ATP-binding cassette domain-containing protein [Propionibacteriaceae bacterium]|jgi:putative ABC transport system ATP-binding protein/lipoprotein-releasing system ATP-binding protein|nr:ATP-binding cassette domain-containing protein [Propionibacteriaceae bacterium]
MRVNVEHVSHQFPGTGVLFHDLSFGLEPGDLVGLTGPSGSGKSTLLSLLARWEQPVAGRVVWESVGSVGWVFQNPYGVAGRTAIDHVALPLLAKGLSRRDATARAGGLLDRFGLRDVADRPYSALSGGEGQRLMLARAVAKAPDMLLVDEPTAQLDPTAAQTVDHVLGQLASEFMIVVVATHDPRTAAACRRLIDLGDWQVGGDERPVASDGTAVESGAVEVGAASEVEVGESVSAGTPSEPAPVGSGMIEPRLTAVGRRALGDGSEV